MNIKSLQDSKVWYSVDHRHFSHRLSSSEDESVWVAAKVTRTYRKTVDLLYRYPDGNGDNYAYTEHNAKKVRISALHTKNPKISPYIGRIFDGFDQYDNTIND